MSLRQRDAECPNIGTNAVDQLAASASSLLATPITPERIAEAVH
jgi:hypothetical protein